MSAAIRRLDTTAELIKRLTQPVVDQLTGEIDTLHARIKELESREAELRALLDEAIAELSRTES